MNRGAGQAPKETLAPGVTQGRAPALPTFLVVGKLLGENSARCVTVPGELARRGRGRIGFEAGRCRGGGLGGRFHRLCRFNAETLLESGSAETLGDDCAALGNAGGFPAGVLESGGIENMHGGHLI